MEVRPRRLLVVARSLAALLVVVFAILAWALGKAPDGQLSFRLSDQLAMFGLGLLMAAAVLLLTRPRVSADETGVRVRNVLGETALPWQVVRSVRLVDGAPWAVLELQDDDEIALLAVQSNDGAHAVDAVLALRRLLQTSRRGTEA